MQPPPGGYPPNPPPPGSPPTWGAPPGAPAAPPAGSPPGQPPVYAPAALYGNPQGPMGSMPLQHPSGLPPHRGTLIMVLGILGILTCQVVGIVAWVLGNRDLAEMDAGRMDPSGRDLTRVGKILGMIAVGLMLLGIVFAMVFGIGFLIAAFH